MVSIALGSVSVLGEVLWEAAHSFSCRRCDDGIVLTWPEARFNVSATRVVVDAADQALVVDLLLHPVWSVVLAARGLPAFHASTVARAGRAFAVLGASGVGKTTAALRMLDRGWRLVADDLLTFDEHNVVLPGPPYVGVVTESPQKVRSFSPTAGGPASLSALVVLSEECSMLGRLSGASAVNKLLEHVYNPIIMYPDQAKRHFDLAVDLVNRLPVYGAPPRSLTAAQLEQLAEDSGL